MISIRRGEAPAILLRKKQSWDSALGRAENRKQRDRIFSRYRHEQIKKRLVETFHGKCAYCESRIVHVDYGHIEHFRPKSRHEYAYLAFDWNNLFLACSVCNGAEFKGTDFPGPESGGPPVNPCDDDPSEHLEFLFDSKAMVATVTYKTERGRTTIDLVGLNRPDLRSYRSNLITKLAALSRFAAIDTEARALLDESVRDESEYAAFARTLVL